MTRFLASFICWMMLEATAVAGTPPIPPSALTASAIVRASGNSSVSVTNPNTFVTAGDSRDAGKYLDGAKRNKSTNNEFNWANRLTGYRAVIVGSFGVSGQTTVQQLAFADQIAATPAANFWFRGMVNDFTANIPTGTPAYACDPTSLTTTWGATWCLLEKVRLSGKRIWVCLEPGSSNQSAAQIGLRNDGNQHLREYARTTPNVILIDIPGAALNPVATTVVVWKTDALGNTFSSDGTHFTTVGAYNVAVAEVAPKFLQYLAPAYNSPVDTLAILGNGSAPLTPNPMFKVGTGGTPGTGNTGVLPGSVTGSRTGTASAVFAVQANPDGYGNEITIAMTSGAQNDRVRLAQNLSTSALAGGNMYVQIGAEIDVASGATGLFYAGIGVDVTIDSVHYFNNDAISTVDRLEDKGGYAKLKLQTDCLSLPAGTVSAAQMNFNMLSFGAGTSSLKLRNTWAVKCYLPMYPP